MAFASEDAAPPIRRRPACTFRGRSAGVPRPFRSRSAAVLNAIRTSSEPAPHRCRRGRVGGAAPNTRQGSSPWVRLFFPLRPVDLRSFFCEAFFQVLQPRKRIFFVVLTELFMGELRILLGLVDSSRTPSGAFFREVHPGSEMASQK